MGNPRFKRYLILVLGLPVLIAGTLTATHFAGRKPNGSVPESGTQRMAAQLAALARSAVSEYGFNNQVVIDSLRASLSQPLSPEQVCYVRLRLGLEFLKIGKNEEAGEEFRVASQLVAENPDPEVKKLYREATSLLGTSFLRIAEQENCVAHHNSASCLLPILPGSLGVHQDQRGSRLAVERFMQALEYDSEDLAARWLLNIAHMTLGEYPDQVSEPWRIPPEAFASDIDFPRFHDIAGALGLDSVGLAGGVVVEDFDRDGFLDIVVSSVGYTDQLRLFHNNGNGSFADWTDRAGLKGIVGGANLCHADYNNDGYPDVLVLRGGWQKDAGRQPNSLLRNNRDGTFADVTEAAGMLSLRPRQTAAWADFDGDGWLDLFVGNESVPPLGLPCELYHNNQNETFTECAARLRIAVDGICKGVAWGDYNNDGRPDLYISRNGAPNVLLRNDGPLASMKGASASEKRKRFGPAWWTFTDTTEQAGVSEPLWSFPVWFWDYDNDGWEDLFVLGFDNSRSQLKHVAADYLGLPHTASLSRLYRNKHDGTFEDVTQQVGLNKAILAMGCNFGDLDNDGHLDFYVGTGDPDLRTLIPNRMFRNDQGAYFQDVTTAGGFGHLQKGHGIAFADLDNDGDQDIYADMGGFYVADVAHNVLFENPGFGNHWLTLRLEGVRSNRFGVGSRIRVDVDGEAGPRSIFVTVGTGGSFGSSSLQQEIGLGQAKRIASVSITWPATGKTDTYESVPFDRIVYVQEGNPQVKKVEAPKPISFSKRDTKDLLAPGATLEKVVSDLQFSEGPAWHPDGYLLFEDIPRDRIMKLEGGDRVSVFREPSGHSNGLAFDKEGRLVAAEGNSTGGGRRISRSEKDGKVVTLADRYNGKRLNSPNDLAIDAAGRIYFTDPRYGSQDGVEQDKEAVYRIDPDGTLTRIIDSVSRPNGIAISIDQKTMYLADNREGGAKRVLMAFDLAQDGSATNGRVLYDFGSGRGIDGMTLDSAGRIWATAGSKEKSGVHVFEMNADRTSAKLLTVVNTPEDPTNCTFGGPGRDVLYITTATSLFRIRTTVNSVASPPGK